MYYSLILVWNFSNISNFTCEITELPQQPSVRLSVKMMTKSKNFIIKCQGIKRCFRKPKHMKEHIKKDSINEYYVKIFGKFWTWAKF